MITLKIHLPLEIFQIQSYGKYIISLTSAGRLGAHILNERAKEKTQIKSKRIAKIHVFKKGDRQNMVAKAVDFSEEGTSNNTVSPVELLKDTRELIYPIISHLL